MDPIIIDTNEKCPVCEKGAIVQKHYRSSDILAQEYIEHLNSFCNNKKCGLVFERPSIFRGKSKEKILDLLEKLKNKKPG